MRQVVRFSLLLLPCAILSVVLIGAGVLRWALWGMSFGIDFQSGLIERLRIAPPAFSLVYTGTQSMQFFQDEQKVVFTVSSPGVLGERYEFLYTEYPTLRAFSEGAKKVEHLSVTLHAPETVYMRDTFSGAEGSTLSSASCFVHYFSEDVRAPGVEELRRVLKDVPSAVVQQVGVRAEHTFQVRVAAETAFPSSLLPEQGGTALAQSDAPDLVTPQGAVESVVYAALVRAYGADHVVRLAMDFVGSRFSHLLVRQALLLVLGALVLIFLYVALRFRWFFALGAIVALVHDACIMVSFMVWFGLEFNSASIAAILTIIGYSINDTVVVFDRVRQTILLDPIASVTTVLDRSQTDMLTRTVVTTVTTLLAALMLYVFTEGGSRDFSLALMVGMVSGVYSTIYIAGGCIALISRGKSGGQLLGL